MQGGPARRRERRGGHSTACHRGAARAHRGGASDARRGVREAGGGMKKVLLVAGREFVATVSTKAFIIGLLIMPVFLGVVAIVFPRLLNPRNFKTTGEIAIIDPTGRAMADIQKAFSPERIADRREERAGLALNQAPEPVRPHADS